MSKALLYIDDEVELPHFVSRVAVLRRDGGFKVVALDAEAGLRELREHPSEYDGILLDVIMEPGPLFSEAETDSGQDTGLRVLERIREIAPAIPVIVVTIRRDEDLLPRVHRLGVREVIVKPIELSTLVDKISHALGGGG